MADENDDKVRYNLVFSKEMNELLERMARRKGKTKADILERFQVGFRL
jgi:hypothetical protein